MSIPNMGRSLLVAVALVLAAGCASRKPANPDSAAKLDLGKHTFQITTSSPDAQKAFNRGLTWAYAFGHYAAEQEFRRALQFDPQCAMAYWGIALVNGPHINYPMVPPQRAATAWAAVTNAMALAPRTSTLEQALIGAVSRRYQHPQPEDRGPLDKAYADAMRELWHKYPNNADVGTLFAEAAMDLHPWDLWAGEEPQPWTPEIVSTLETVLRLNSNHPGANHLYIHAVEASSQPDRALAAADRLGKMVPSSSHLIHMPAHIYVRVGKWREAAESNIRAMAADAKYRQAYPRPDFYALYMAHNSHFLAFTAMMRGRSEEALRIGRQMVANIPRDFQADHMMFADGFLAFVPEVLMRFGRWEEILNEPAPPQGMRLAKALWHFTRASAFTNLDRMQEARVERGLFVEAKDQIPKDWTFGNNLASDLAEIAERVLDGEIAAQSGDLKTAIERLRAAAALEDKLRYDEPPDWIQPVRHTLGAVLLRAGDYAEAESVYHQDLGKFPENGWSLMGLRDALEAQGKMADASSADSRFKRAWAQADVNPSATCYCQAGRARADYRAAR